jgi:hypothetical protein
VNKVRVFEFEKVSKRDRAGKSFRINLFTYNIPWFNYTVKIRYLNVVVLHKGVWRIPLVI